MKLLLTSAGLTNITIVTALQELAGKPFNQLTLAFIPTAANVEPGDKDWLIDNLLEIKKLNLKEVDIVDISAIPEELWRPRLESADILLFSGGNTWHLLHAIKTSGLADLLPEMLKTKIYVGISAGCMVISDKILMSQSVEWYCEPWGSMKDENGLGYVKFQFRPHLNSPHFPNVRLPMIEEKIRDIPEPVYVLDDQSAIQVNDNEIKVVSEGEWKKFN